MAKLTAQSKTSFSSSDKSRKTPVIIEFKRLGPKGGKNTKEYFWLEAQGALTTKKFVEMMLQKEKKNINKS